MNESNKTFAEVLKLMKPWMLSALEKRYKRETGLSSVGDSPFDFTDKFLEWEDSYYKTMFVEGGTPEEIIARMRADLK